MTGPTQARFRLGRCPPLARPRVASAVLLLALLSPVESAAQASRTAARGATQSPLSRRYIATTWTVENGLPQNSVNAILQTRDGYLWLGTFGGLARFDGVQFTVFNSGNTPGLKSNRILSLYEDRAGTLWIGTETGDVMCLKGTVATTLTTSDGLPGGLIWCFHEDAGGTMWIGTTNGLAEWRNRAVRTYTTRDGLAGNRVWSIHEDRPGHMWIGTDLGLGEFSNGKGTARYTAAGGVRVVRPDADGSLAVVARDGVVRLAHGQFTPYADGLPTQTVRAMAGDRAGNVWLGYFEVGAVSLLRPDGGPPETLDLGPAGTRALSIDREGNVWVGTAGGGLVRLRERAIRTYSKDEGLPSDSVQAITDDGADGAWAATGAGLVHISGGAAPAFTTYTTDDGLPDNFVRALHRDRQGTLWLAGQWLMSLKDGVFTTYREVAPDIPIHVIAGDEDSNLWIGTERGLVRFSGGQFTTYRTAQGLVNDDVRFILPARDGSLWLGTVGGLSHFHDGAFTNYTLGQGLSHDYVRTIVEQADGTLWIGTYGGGLNRFRDGRFTPITTRDGLFDDFVSQILEDDRGRFWMLSNRGIFHVALKQLKDFADRRTSSIACISYGVADGMKNSEGNGGNQPSAWKALDGALWFATIRGLVAIDPAPASSLLPPAVIEQVVLDRQALPFERTVQIDPGKDSLEIHYTGLSLSRPEQLRFRYRLNGHDQAWVDAGTRRVAYYSHVPPGTYVFSVMASSSDGVWNEAAATLKVVVVPPFWRTWPFLSLVAASAAGVLFALYRRRIEHLKSAHAVQEAFSRQLLDSQERERQRIAAELHDGLGQSLLIIKNRAFLASRSNGDRDDAREQLDEIGASASQAIDEVREIAYNLRPYQLDRFGLTRTLQAIFTKFSGPSGARFTTDLDPIDGLFSKEDEISIYRIVQESLNNIVKHANATEAGLSIEREAGDVCLRIRDNGRGFRPVAAASTDGRPGGFGLTGMAERVRMLGGTCAIDSAPGQGTTITIRLSVAK